MKLNISYQAKAYIMITLSAALFTLGIQAFLQVVEIFSAGIGAFAALPTFIWGDGMLRSYISLIYLGLNIPLILFYWNKNNRKFTYRTIYFLVLQALLGSIFVIFPDVQVKISKLLDHQDNLKQLQWPVILYGILGAVLSGPGIAIAWKYGGSSGGTDIIAYYWTSKRKMNIGMGMMIIALIVLALSFTTTISLNEEMRHYWLATLIGSVSYVIMNTWIVQAIYPKYKKVSIHIVSSKTDKIDAFLKKIKYVHSWKIYEFEAGYSRKKRKEISTTLFLLELRDLEKQLRNIDKNLWIQIIPVKDVHGHMNSQHIDTIK